MYQLVNRGKEGHIQGYPDFFASLLSARGITTPEEADVFLHPAAQPLCDPFDMPGMREAVQLILNARQNRIRTVIYGDYDADGVCASAILYLTLKALDMPVVTRLPDRHGDGYGLNMAAVEEIAGQAQMIITVDNGITAIEEVRHAKELGLTVVVTDHHRRQEELPPADAIVCPSLGGYPCEFLCGAGVAFEVSRALLGDWAVSLIDLCALATVADMVPLRGENRTITALGLKAIENTRRPGLRALLRVASLSGTVTARDVGFRIAPRINACGRLESPDTALRLILCEDEDEAVALASKTQLLNDRRKEMENAILDEAREKLKDYDLVSLHAVVLWDEKWDIGVCGLAAGRIADETGYPTVILSWQGDTMTGSARSGGNVDIHAALTECADILTRFGGHKAAAGMTLETRNAEAFRRRLSEAVIRQTEGRVLMPCREYDARIRLSDVTVTNIRLLSSLEPFGMQNPEPVFLVTEAQPVTLGRVGAEGRHLRGCFSQDGTERSGIAFSCGSQADTLPDSVDILCGMELNEFGGRITPQINISLIKPAAGCIPADEIREAEAILQDLEKLADAEPCAGQEAADSSSTLLPADGQQSLAQGVCVICRSRESVLHAVKEWPSYDVFSFGVEDARAYNGIMYACCMDTVSSRYRQIILYDGELCPGEGALWQKKTGGHVYVRDRSCSDWLRGHLSVSKDMLRDVYRAARGQCTGLSSLSAAAGVNAVQTLASLHILRHMGLLRFDFSPFAVAMLPAQKCDPEKDRLFQTLALPHLQPLIT